MRFAGFWRRVLAYLVDILPITFCSVGKVLSFAPCGLGAIWIAWSPETRAWHDYIAGTLVVLADEQAPEQQGRRE